MKRDDVSLRLFVTIGILVLVVRAGTLLLAPGALANDPDGYRLLAANLAENGVFGYGPLPTAYRPPLYPLMLVPCLAFGSAARFAIGVLHVGLGLATVCLVVRLGRRWGLGRWSVMAALLVACDPILLVQSTQIMTETAATFLAVISLGVLTSPRRKRGVKGAMLAGASLALATLCRASFLAFLLLAAVALPLRAGDRKRAILQLAAYLAGAALVLAPWTIRNHRQIGRPIVATTHGGYTLLLANNASFYEYLRRGDWGHVWDADEFNRNWRARAPRVVPADEPRNDRLAYTEAIGHIGREPVMFAYACLVRVGRLWSPLPHALDAHEGSKRRLARYAVGVWYGVELGLALVGLWCVVFRRFIPSNPPRTQEENATSEARKTPLASGEPIPSHWWSTWLWGLLLIVAFTAVHALFWTNLRMRAPLMPVVALGAAAGMAWIHEAFVRRKCCQ